MFDEEHTDLLKLVRGWVQRDMVVGMVFVNRPDFELGSFTADELLEVAIRFRDGDLEDWAAVRSADWAGVQSGKDFDQRFVAASESRIQSLKGKDWGHALASFALEHPTWRSGDARPVVRAIRAGHQSRGAHYDYEREHFRLDPDTFERRDR
jgi:hypothetical protein